MALATTSKKMREEATCSVCLQLMAEPVSISCGHSYCQACLLSFMGLASSPLRHWRRETFSCPQCQAPFQRGSLRPNKQLGSLIATLRELDLEQKQELFCQQHGERLLLFCEVEDQLICWCCERGLRHKGHATSLVEDAGPVYREQLQEAVRKLRQLEEECASQKASMAKQIAEWNEKIEAGRQKIQEDFQNLLSFLREEEKRYLWRLESEKEHTLRRLRDREAKLGQQSQELESCILELEERCQGSAKKMLQDVKAALSRSQAVRLETPEALSLEVQTQCEFRKLYFDPIERLRSHQVGVTLDPETAHPELILSKDQRQVTRGGCPQGAGDPSPRRFMVSPCILGRQSFMSGWQYFEVDVGEGVGWDVGVCLESVQRLMGSFQKPEAGFWALRLCPRDGYRALTWPRTPLGLEKPPLVVGVLVDCEVGVVSFYNATSGSHLFTFPRASFPGVLRPYFQVSPCSPLFLPSPDE